MSQRKIESFFVGGGVKLGEKRKACDDSVPSSRDKKYDSEKRSRKFQTTWCDKWHWLIYDESKDVMTCKYCTRYPSVANRHEVKNTFVEGCTKFRIEYLKIHDGSAVHNGCLSYYRHDGVTSDVGQIACDTKTDVVEKEGRIIQCFQKMDQKHYEQLEKLFVTAFLIASRRKPLSDFQMHLDLSDRLDVDIGINYRNIDGATKFIQAIATTLRKDFISEIKKANYITLLSDGSTDSAVKEQETVFVRYVSEGVPVSFHLGIVALEHAHAEGVLDGIKSALQYTGLSYENIVSPDKDLEGPKLVSVNFDGAAVMMGQHAGVSAKIKVDAPYLIGVHCVAHKLELSVLDAVNQKGSSLVPLKTFEETLKQIFRFYHVSPKMKRELKAISEIFETDLVHLSDVKQVRWLASKIRAVQALRTSLHSVIQHIQTVATGKTDKSSKAKNWLAKMNTVTFMKTLFIVLDVLPMLTQVSQIFQKEDLLLTEVSKEVEGVMLKILQLKLQPDSGENLQAFMELYSPQDKTFDSVIKLHGTCNPVNFKQDVFFISLLDGITKYIDQRFECFSKPPLKYFNVLDYTEWPNHYRCKLSLFGNEGLLKHYAPLFSETEKSKIKEEYTTLKGHLRDCKKPMYQCYSILVYTKPEAFRNLSKVIELMFAISPATAICERLFSSMNIVKTSQRTVLSQNNLNNILTIMTHGPKHLSEFQPQATMKEWMTSCKDTRHVRGHAVKQQQETCEIDVQLLGAALKAKQLQ